MDLFLIGILIIIYFLVIYVTMKSRFDALEARIKSMKYTLEQIAEKTGADVEPPVNNRLRELLKEKKTVKAVKEARNELGLSLVEAKKYVDALKLDD